MDVLILVASKGMNVKLGESLAAEVEKQGGSCETINLVDIGLPLYPCESDEATKITEELTAKVSEAKSLIAVAPEYNGSLPPALNNAIAWISVTSKEWRDAFNGKPVAISTHSGGGGSYVLSAMRQQFAYVGCNVLGRQILTHYKKELNPESAEAVVSELLKYASV